MALVTVIARVKARAGAEEQVFEASRKLILTTLAEEGCIDYDLHRSIEDPGLFMFYENWTSRSLWEQHMNAPHVTGFSEETEGLVEMSELFVGEKVEA